MRSTWAAISCAVTKPFLISSEWMASSSTSVVDPRGVLADFGVELPKVVEVRVHDSTADLRYIVLPLRPKGTRGWTEAELAASSRATA